MAFLQFFEEATSWTFPKKMGFIVLLSGPVFPREVRARGSPRAAVSGRRGKGRLGQGRCSDGGRVDGGRPRRRPGAHGGWGPGMLSPGPVAPRRAAALGRGLVPPRHALLGSPLRAGRRGRTSARVPVKRKGGFLFPVIFLDPSVSGPGSRRWPWRTSGFGLRARPGGRARRAGAAQVGGPGPPRRLRRWRRRESRSTRAGGTRGDGARHCGCARRAERSRRRRGEGARTTGRPASRGGRPPGAPAPPCGLSSPTTTERPVEHGTHTTERGQRRDPK